MRAATLLFSCLLAAAPAGAAAAEATGVLTRAPAVVEPATPEYPADAKARGLSAEVVLELDVGADGQVLAARVTAPAGDGFDEAALEAARRLRFSPAEIDGKPAAVTLEYRFRFDAPPPAAAAAAPAPAGDAVLRGLILERGTRAPLAGASVSTSSGASAFTDKDGRFELGGLSPGPVQVVAADPAHHRFETSETLEAGKAVEVTYYLRRMPADGYEAVVIGERERKEVASVTITTGEVTRLAGVSGDTVRVVQNLPGVARQPGGFGTLVVRGGNPNDTRVYVDGVEVPLIFHFGGLTSIVPAELAKSVDFEAGNFGVRYGRATGGRVDLTSRDPEDKRLHLVADANLFHAMTFVEGSASEDVAVAVAARRSYADAVIEQATKSSDAFDVTTAPRYYDYQAKVRWRASPDDVVRLSLFGSDDRMKLTGVDTGGLEEFDQLKVGSAFTQLGVSWDHRVSDASRVRVALAQSFMDEADRFGADFGYRHTFHITTLRAEGSSDLGERLTLAAGMDTRFLPSGVLALEFPPIPPPNRLPDPQAAVVRYDKHLQGVEAGLWTEAIWKPVDGLVVTPGLRADRVAFLGDMFWLDPRLSVRYTPREGTTLKGGAGLYHQAPIAPYLTREWGNPDLREEGAWHFMTGVEQRLWGPLTADVQLYYKRLFDLAWPSERVVERDGQRVAERYANTGTGKAYGAELLVRWNPGGRFFGWLAYSLSRSVRDEDVVGGSLVPGGENYDQPHNLVALGTVDLPELWDGFSAGFRVRWTSGNPYRPVAGAVYDSDGDAYSPVEDAALGGRAPDFFQLDLRFDKKWTWKTWILSAYLEAQNVTNRKNPEGPAYNYDYSQRGWYSGLPFFPSFGVRAEY